MALPVPTQAIDVFDIDGVGQSVESICRLANPA